MDSALEFPTEVAQQLKSYVYKLIDPRTGTTFYVGKGKGNRVFAHARAERGFDGDPDDHKLSLIREIQLAGLQVWHIIHRHGMDDETASEVEAALIDATPGLANLMRGSGSNDFGPMNADSIIKRYQAETAVFHHRAMLISINRSALHAEELYQATRFAWKVSLDRAREAEVVLARYQGMIVEAFIAEQWLPATPENFPGQSHESNRYGFVGFIAPEEIRALYVQKKVPSEYRKRGAANPITYTY
jgi:uncharacterized protein